jgi:YD repeat-containing protein
MKSIYSLLFLLTFFSQTAFSQDYSKMSANEKAKVIIYGDLYPYSLLLENGSDTLHLSQKDLFLIFEEGKLIQVNNEEGSTTKYVYQAEKIVRVDIYDEDTTYLIAAYNKDSLKYVVPSPKISSFDDDFFGCDDMREGYSDFCVYYKSNIIFQGYDKWIFLNDKIVTEFHPMGNFPYFDNQKKTFFVKGDYVNILSENFFTEEQLESEYSKSDFITEEKHEIKFKIRKFPKDKTKKFWEEEGH